LLAVATVAADWCLTAGAVNEQQAVGFVSNEFCRAELAVAVGTTGHTSAFDGGSQSRS